MKELTVYKCLECGHYVISRNDGNRCPKCKGALAPFGNATNVDTNKGLTVNVSIKDIDVFQGLISLLKMVLVDKNTTITIKNAINNYLHDINDEENIKNIVCQNCGALLSSYNDRIERIHLPSENIEIENDLFKLKCHCGCITQYHIKR